MKHLSRKISEYGRDIVANHMKFTESDASPTGYYVEHEGNKVPCKVFTKRHDEKEDLRVTGRDERDVLHLISLRIPILLIFVDCSFTPGMAYGAILTDLMEPVEYSGKQFPWRVPTHKGKIIYWSIELMPTLFIMSPEEREKLALMVSDNQHDKNQMRLL